MTARKPDGRRRGKEPKLTPEAIVRRGSAEFSRSLAALQGAVRESCSRETEWEARIVAGIGAALDFAVRDVPAARAVTVNARARASETAREEMELVSYFGRLLDEITPKMLFPISSPEGIVETTAILIRGQLLAGTPEKLAELGPHLIHLTLMPYVGSAGAERWAATFPSASDH